MSRVAARVLEVVLSELPREGDLLTAASHLRGHLSLVPDRRREELERATRVLKARHYRPATMKAYLFWMDRFCAFHAPADLWELREPAVNAFLTRLGGRYTE